MFTISVTGTILIDIPALTAYVEYLQAGQQKQLEAVAARLAEATAAQKKPTTELEMALEQQQK